LGVAGESLTIYREPLTPQRDRIEALSATYTA
jgi:hypothetical protein